MSAEKPPVPSGDAKVWHSRQWRDSLGYYRARTMVNPDWYDPDHLAKSYLEPERAYAEDETERDLIDKAILAAKKYSKGVKRGARSDEQYAKETARQRAQVFDAVDALLAHRNEEHRKWWLAAQPKPNED